MRESKTSYDDKDKLRTQGNDNRKEQEDPEQAKPGYSVAQQAYMSQNNNGSLKAKAAPEDAARAGALPARVRAGRPVHLRDARRGDGGQVLGLRRGRYVFFITPMNGRLRYFSA